ncbi:DegT/DnrJ/EryC1/StrS family aminotransferase [Stakelama pacifica]|uniref:dTDP-4-amino-4,6-dideoxygalactose transaminase n=1 Tax=Stakelama pacifica TaxID=517720 RepID=A0A4V3BSD7_9SPHN|nr:DegT/DnrJ/EryC1/StrS family aminotransferase [Stakelama pacifica]TDN79038.1 dTDP-4-amino-4,6-dideoxygalactose transaminase [Stakelama pacifica]
MHQKHIALISPNPPKLSLLGDELHALERSGQFSNGGPQVTAFERDALKQLFQGEGDCHAVANATLGLMLAIREAVGRDWRGERYAMMPAFTFAATAHAAQWAGLTPLFVDSDPDDWAACAAAEQAALERYGDRIAAVIPYATFGTCIDLDRYRVMADRHGIAVVIDAAASLGAIDERGRGFGAGYPFTTVFSMHATKPFATAEGGLVYSADTRRIAAIREMGNFGFGAPRLATRPGINAKLPEVLGLLARAKLSQINAAADHRTRLLSAYSEALRGFSVQRLSGRRPLAQFQSLLLPRNLAPQRDRVIALLGEAGIGAGSYFTPHLGKHPHFAATALCEAVPVAEDIATRVLSLPLHDAMEVSDVPRIADAMFDALARVESRAGRPGAGTGPDRTGTAIIGGGPGGMAVMIAAAREGRIEQLAERGLTIIDRSATLGDGRLGEYAITSDSTAETFLTAIAESPYPEIAALADAPGSRIIQGYKGALGVPLALTPPFLRELAERITGIAERAGARILRGVDAEHARRLGGGGWSVALRLPDGERRELVADNLLIATGGRQCIDTSRAEKIVGQTLGALAGERLILSGDVIRTGGMAALARRLADVRAPRIAVVGGSTSALSTVALLLKAQPALPLGADAIRLIHRRPLRPFFPSVEAAHAEGFTDFTDADICPISGFVYRLAGFRLEARELLLRMLAVGGRVPDPRVAMIDAVRDEAAARTAISDADIVIAALGYRPNGMVLQEADGTRIALAADAPGRPRLVNQRCQVIDASGNPLPDAYGIGLAAGFVPEGRLGGEPSFQGKANGLWLWQNDVGSMIIDSLLEKRARAAA